MQYEKISNTELNLKFESKNFLSIFGLYLFSLGAVTSGYSIYLFLEATERIERNVISWSGEGLFWSLILFFFASESTTSEKFARVNSIKNLMELPPAPQEKQ